MIGSGMSRRDRTVLAVVVVVVLYAVAALIWFTGRGDAWAKAQKGYQNACRAFEKEKKLVASRARLREEAETESLKMPVAEEGESTQTRWQRKLEEIAKQYSISIVGEQPKPEEEHGGVWELPIEVKYVASLRRLVEFLHALNTTEGTMFDVRDLDISTKNNGDLSGKFTLTCAYMKAEDAAITAAPKSEKKK